MNVLVGSFSHCSFLYEKQQPLGTNSKEGIRSLQWLTEGHSVLDSGIGIINSGNGCATNILQTVADHTPQLFMSKSSSITDEIIT